MESGNPRPHSELVMHSRMMWIGFISALTGGMVVARSPAADPSVPSSTNCSVLLSRRQTAIAPLCQINGQMICM